MNKVILIVIMLITKTILFSQNYKEIKNTRPLNLISVNLLGDASLASVNYERLTLLNASVILSTKIGVGSNEDNQIFCFRRCSEPERFLTIPHHLTWNFGKEKHFFELGFGGTLISKNEDQPYFFYPIIGYRILPLKTNRLNFRLFIQVPVTGISSDDNVVFIPFGLNLGISF